MATVVASVLTLMGTVWFINHMSNYEERRVSPPRHAYAGLPKQWIPYGVTEGFALQLKEWNSESKAQEDPQAVAERYHRERATHRSQEAIHAAFALTVLGRQGAASQREWPQEDPASYPLVGGELRWFHALAGVRDSAAPGSELRSAH